MAESELNSLGVDLGNSAIKVYELPALDCPAPPPQSDPTELLTWCATSCRRFDYDDRDSLMAVLRQADQIDLISVSPTRSAQLVTRLTENYPQINVRTWSTAQVPMLHPYERPEMLGTDRLVAAYASRCLYPQLPIIVVDLGSAVTVDLVTALGAFAGGAIAPGLTVLNEGLAAKGAQLWQVDLAAAWKVKYPAKNSADALALGLVGSFCGSVLELIQVAMNSLSATDLAQHRLLLCGGDAEHVQDFLAARGLAPVLVPNLLQLGLAQLARLTLPNLSDLEGEES